MLKTMASRMAVLNQCCRRLFSQAPKFSSPSLSPRLFCQPSPYRSLSSMILSKSRLRQNTRSHFVRSMSTTPPSPPDPVLDAKKFVPRRAMLYVPGDDENKLKKIPIINADCAILECEDGVALNRKVSRCG